MQQKSAGRFRAPSRWSPCIQHSTERLGRDPLTPCLMQGKEGVGLHIQLLGSYKQPPQRTSWGSFFGHEACRILVPPSRAESGPQQWKPQVLTTGPTANSWLALLASPGALTGLEQFSCLGKNRHGSLGWQTPQTCPLPSRESVEEKPPRSAPSREGKSSSVSMDPTSPGLPKALASVLISDRCTQPSCLAENRDNGLDWQMP